MNQNDPKAKVIALIIGAASDTLAAASESPGGEAHQALLRHLDDQIKYLSYYTGLLPLDLWDMMYGQNESVAKVLALRVGVDVVNRLGYELEEKQS